jgi:hypothetical protein
MNLLTPAQIARKNVLVELNDAYNAAWKNLTKGKRNYITKEESESLNQIAPFSNELRGELETLLFLSTPAQKEFVYPNMDSNKLTGFMGNVLMGVTYKGPKYRGNMGDIRYNVRARGINGISYYGTVYGTYARMSPNKS